MAEDLERRILVFAPSGRDGPLAAQALAAHGIGSFVCPDERALCAEIARGVGAVLLTEYALTSSAVSALAAAVADQPAWSDLPILALIPHGDDGRPRAAAERALMTLGNATLLDRPLSPSSLISAAAGALRARGRQYALRDLLARVEREVRHRDEFLAMLGHELRNPLGAIRNATEVLIRGSTGEDGGARQLAVIDRQTRHLGRMVDDLLDVARISAGKISLRPVRLDTRTLAETVVQQLSPWARDKRLEVSVVASVHEAPVRGDPVRIEQVFANLLTNAIKYTPPGGRITVSIDVEDGHARVTVADTGAGIAAEMLPVIFDLFRQAEGTLDRARGGMGIGLTLVRTLVALHGGRVEAQSRGLGCGAQFVVWLPLTDEAATAGSSALAASSAPRRILVVDDSPDNRDSLRDVLETLGHAVEVASDGPGAVASALAYHPDVAVIDIGLPGFDGYTVAEKVRRALGPRPLLIALTGYGQLEDQRRANRAGFDAHLTKPADIDQLHAIIAGHRAMADG